MVELSKTLWLPLDDMSAVAELIIKPKVLGSGLDRCPRHYGVSNYPKSLLLTEDRAAFKPAYVLGFVHIKVKCQPQSVDKGKRQYLRIALDGTGPSAFVQPTIFVSLRTLRAFLHAFTKVCLLRIRTVIANNIIKAGTDRFITSEECSPTVEQLYGTHCRTFTSEHPVTYLRRPWTKGPAKRFNGRLEDVRRLHHLLVCGENLEKTLPRIACLRNHGLASAARNARTPMRALKQQDQTHQYLFVIRPHDCPELDTEAGLATVLLPCDKATIRACVLHSALNFPSLATTRFFLFNRSTLIHPISL